MASYNHDHPLPAPPPQQGQQQYYGQQRPTFTATQAPPPQVPAGAHHYPQHQQAAYPPAPPPHHQQQQQQRQQPQAPAPVPSQKQERPRPESRKSRAFSFRSDKSQKTDKSISGGAYKVTSAQLHETSAEKEAKRLHSKADPTLAMNEAEPALVAQSATDYTLHTPLRSIQHKDSQGVPISEPDRSNPTRSRWERPLDTIRSFEAAIDGGYSRKSMYRADSDSVANWNKRNSYFANNGPSRFPRESYYGGRPMSMRPESGMNDQEGGQYSGYANAPRNRFSRMNSEPYTNGRPAVDKTVYPIPNNHRSYETVASGSGNSGSLGEPAGYQTDPTSSENSSIDRRSPPKRPEQPPNDYGITFGQTQAYQPTFQAPAPAFPAQPPQYGAAGPPQVPRKDGGGGLLRKGSKMTPSAPPPVQRPEVGEKRKSWLSRRFSRQG